MPLSRRRFASVLVASFVFVCGWSPLAAPGQDFKVSNKVYPPEAKTPAMTTTLFCEGRVYDFLESSDGKAMETIVFDKPNDTIIILDPDRQMKTQFTTGELATQIGRLHEAAKDARNPESIRFAATPRFSEREDEKTGSLILEGNKIMRYVVQTEAPKNPFVAKIYNEAADWLAQTNAMLNPPHMPFARLKLNEVLKKRQEIPVEIELTHNPDGGRKEITVRSEHNIQYFLSASDQRRIEDVKEQLHRFNTVSFEEYHRAPEDKQARK